VIERLFPEWVSTVETFTDDATDVAVFPAEQELLRNAVPKRRLEFTTGRACARQALAVLGVPPAPLLSGPRGEPRWPAGVVGSITHCSGYRAAAVAASARAAAIGIDAEPDDPLPDGVLDAIAVPEELPMLRRLTAVRPDISWGRLLFSAKESVFKAWYPLTGRSLGFDQAIVAIELAGSFNARILVDAPVDVYIGRWLAGDGLVVTGIVVPAGS